MELGSAPSSKILVMFLIAQLSPCSITGIPWMWEMCGNHGFLNVNAVGSTGGCNVAAKLQSYTILGKPSGGNNGVREWEV